MLGVQEILNRLDAPKADRRGPMDGTVPCPRRSDAFALG